MREQYPHKAKVAILDLYNGHPNQGMRCIRQILHEFSEAHQVQLEIREYDVRGRSEVPDLNYDLFISTGGPGSPFDGEGTEWETNYYRWLEDVLDWNQQPTSQQKKTDFFYMPFFPDGMQIL